MFQFPGLAPLAGWRDRSHRVPPFGHPRIQACLQLPEDFRSLPRPSSPVCAKASTVRTYSLDQPSSLGRATDGRDAPSVSGADSFRPVHHRLAFPTRTLRRSAVAGPCEGFPAVVGGRSDLRHFPSFYPGFQEARRYRIRAGRREDPGPPDAWRTALEGSGLGGEVNGVLGRELGRERRD